MSHYDYIHTPSSHGLAGPVEDAAKLLAPMFSAVMQQAQKAGFNRHNAFDFLRFGSAYSSPAGAADAPGRKDWVNKKVADHEITSQFSPIFDVARPFAIGFSIDESKNLSAENKKKVHDLIYYTVWKPVWDAAFPTSSAPTTQTPFRPIFPVGITNQAERLREAAAALAAKREAEKGGVPIVPIVLVAAAAGAAFLFMRKK